MFKSFFAMMLLILAGPCWAQAPVGSRSVVIAKGTVLLFSVAKAASSETLQTGDEIELALVRPLVVNEETVLAAGTKGEAVVRKVRAAGRANCKPGVLEYAVDRVRFADGSEVKTEVEVFYGDLIPERVDPQLVGGERRERVKERVAFVASIPVAIALVFPIPMMIADLADHGPAGRTKGEDVLIQRGARVGVVVAKNHLVRY